MGFLSTPSSVSLLFFFPRSLIQPFVVLERLQEALAFVFWSGVSGPGVHYPCPWCCLLPQELLYQQQFLGLSRRLPRGLQVFLLLRSALHFWAVLSGSLHSQCHIPRLCPFLSDTYVDCVPCPWISLTPGLHISDYAQSVAHRPILYFFPCTLYFVIWDQLS